MNENDMRKSILDVARMFVEQGEETKLFLCLGNMKGEIGLIKELASEMVKALPIVTNEMIGSALVLRLGELIRSDPTQLYLFESLPFHESELGRARYCHILGYGKSVALVFGDQVKRLSNDPSPLVRRRAIQALARLAHEGLTGTQEIIRAAFDDPDPDVQDEAIRSLN